jgi:hypothetical protein
MLIILRYLSLKRTPHCVGPTGIGLGSNSGGMAGLETRVSGSPYSSLSLLGRGPTSFGLACNYPAVGLRLVCTQVDIGGAMKAPHNFQSCPEIIPPFAALGQKCNRILLAQMARPARPKSRVCDSHPLRATIVKGKCV